MSGSAQPTEINPALSQPGVQRIYETSAWAMAAAFGTYFCMYGLRKPYTAGMYLQSSFFGVDYKFLLVIAQTSGYVLSKWLGIKVVSEVRPDQRIRMLVVLVLFSELTLLFFGILPRPLNIVCLFLNGLSLGVVFGMILLFLEGRRRTEILIAGLCTSFIISDGFSKSVGKFLLDHDVSEGWMPFFAGLVFLIPLMIFSIMLGKIPPPSVTDVAQRSERVPMQAQARWGFFIRYAPGIAGIIFIYLTVTLLRSLRADFAPELWSSLGYQQHPALFTQSELIVSLVVAVANGLAILISNHFKALRFSLLISFAGFGMLLLAVAGVFAGMNGFLFMVLAGFGLYVPYVAIHTIVFERLIAITREKANIGFLMYLADAVGYTGYILLMVMRYVLPTIDSILDLFLKVCLYLGLAGGVVTLYCFAYFRKKLLYA